MNWKRVAQGRHEGWCEVGSAVVEYKGFEFEWVARASGMTRKGQARTIAACKAAAEAWIASSEVAQ